MKRILVFILAITCISSVYAQIWYFGAGYAGNKTSLKGINQVVENYNASRSWLDKEMKEFGYLDGLFISTGLGAANIWVDLEMSFRSQKHEANGTDLYGDFGSRYLKLKNGNFAFSIGGIGGEDDFAVAGGLRADFGNEKLLSKVEMKNGKKTDWEVVADPLLSVRLGPSIKFFFGSDGGLFSLSMYYGWSIFNNNVTKYDEEVNHTNYHYEEPTKFDLRSNTFGFTIGFGVFGTE